MASIRLYVYIVMRIRGRYNEGIDLVNINS